jgi:hypothetical protein
MAYVVKAVGPIGDTMWLTAPNLDGNRIFAVRWLADVFELLEDAEDIIAEIKNQADTTGSFYRSKTRMSGR